MPEKIKVLIADDHIMVREGLQQLLGRIDFIQVVGQADSAQSAVQQALTLQPDVVLLDLAWYKDRSAGITAIQQIKQQAPAVKILAATAYQDLIGPARAAGAEMAVDKDALNDKITLAQRIRDTYLTPATGKRTALAVEEPSTRELEVLRLVAQGATDESIAEQLNISVSTTKKHVSSIIGKLHVANRSAAVAVAYEVGLLGRGTVNREQ
jgi:DNA-binding NarL/FixJ family response regulator